MENCLIIAACTGSSECREVVESSDAPVQQVLAAMPAGTPYARARKEHTDNPTSQWVGMSFQSFCGTQLLEPGCCWPMF